MSQLVDDINRYCRRYRVRPLDRLRLLAHYPLFKAAWLSVYGGGATKKAAQSVSRVFQRYKLRHRIFPDGGREMTLALPFDPYDIGIFKQIFWGDEYVYTFEMDAPTTMLDLGANVGMASLYFFARYPNLQKVVAVEPNPQIIGRLKENLAAFAQTGQAEFENLCIGSESGRDVAFSCTPDHTGNRMLAPGAETGAAHVNVKTISVADLLEQHGMAGADFLKMDIEGAELDVITRPDVFRRFRFVAVEVHGGANQREAFAATLEGQNFAIRRVACGTEDLELVFGRNQENAHREGNP